jgi:LCP family protein required for cell wall assembly
MRRRRRRIRRPLLIGIAVVVVAVGIVIGWYLLTQRHVGRLTAHGGRANILLLGLDNVEGTSRSDTMMVASVAPGKDVALLSLPRDLRVKFANGEFHKLNATYTLGGPDLACKTVSDLLGVDVPFYIALGYDGFQRLIDDLGGVTITVKERMVYNDERATPPLHIDIKPGTQTMDGKTALDYIRFRGDPSGDLGRIARQQEMIAAVLKKGFQNKDLATIRKLVKGVHPYLKSDLSLIDLYDLARILQGVGPNRLQMATVPTVSVMIDEVSYLEPQVVEMARLVARMLKGIDLLTPAEIAVAVFNGNGVKQMASNTADYLKKRNFQVSKIANAEVFTYDKTYIVTVSGDAAKAKMLQDALPSGTNSAVVSQAEFEPHYTALKALVPAGTDLILVAGAGFEAKDG